MRVIKAWFAGFTAICMLAAMLALLKWMINHAGFVLLLTLIIAGPLLLGLGVLMEEYD